MYYIGNGKYLKLLINDYIENGKYLKLLIHSRIGNGKILKIINKFIMLRMANT